MAWSPPSLIYYIVILFSSNYLLGHAQKQPFRSTRSYNASLEYLTLNTTRIFRRITKINMLRKQDLVDQKGKKVFLILSKGKKKTGLSFYLSYFKVHVTDMATHKVRISSFLTYFNIFLAFCTDFSKPKIWTFFSHFCTKELVDPRKHMIINLFIQCFPF